MSGHPFGKGRKDVSTEDKIVLDASSLSDEELVEKAGRIIRDHWIGEIWWEWNGMRPFSDWEHLIYETHLSRLMEPKRVYFSADENFVNFFLGKTGTAILTQLESADEILFFANDEKGKGVKEAGKSFPHESFRLFPHRDTEVCRKFVCQVRKVHRPFQRTLAEKAGYFYPVVVISFPGSSASYEGENLLRISLLAVGITMQTLPFVLIGVLLSTGMQLYSSRPPWEISIQEAPGSLCAACAHRRVLLSLLRLRADAAFQGLLQKGRARCDYHDIPHGRPSDESGRPR